MSAFLVSDRTIHVIVTHFNRNPESGYSFRKIGYLSDDTESLDRLASDLYLMNCDALDARYGKGTAATDTADAIAFTYRARHVNKIHVYKAARCLRYQCAEGNINERPLFKALNEFIESIAYSVISEMPEFEVAPWG